MTVSRVSRQTRTNWWIDTALFGSALIAALSGIYFLFLPSGGYRGGRNSLYNVQVLFTRQAWDDLHTWGGVLMIAAALLHLAFHWKWVAGMAQRILNELTGRCGCVNSRGRWNLVLNFVVGLGFLLTAISGVYFLFFPGGRGAIDPLILFARATWDSIHTWAGIVLVSAAILHFAIHWKWVERVTGNLLAPGPSRTSPAANS